MHDKPIGARKSSFELVDIKRLLSELRLSEDSVSLDVACGRGANVIAHLPISAKEAEYMRLICGKRALTLYNGRSGPGTSIIFLHR
jgi:hypothetical protein